MSPRIDNPPDPVAWPRDHFPVGQAQIMVRLEGERQYQYLFWYYIDEISFTPEELVGKTAEEA